MRPSFRGFEQEEDMNSSTSQQTESISGSSRDTSPTSVSPEQPSTVQKKKQDTKSIVRRLVEHFSNSDSENTEITSASTRRRSKSVVHTELPRGGERGLRRMSNPNHANDAVKLWKALSGILKETMDEAFQALDRNETTRGLVGHKAAIVSLEGEFELA